MILKNQISLLIGILLLFAGTLAGCKPLVEVERDEVVGREEQVRSIQPSDRVIQEAFESRVSDIQVQGDAVVYRILSDDLDGSRHQRFLLRMRTGLSLLISHNIDLAPRIPDIQVGDTVFFYGEYEYNDKGGVVHWTHHDPRGRHVGGWLKHNGNIYQ